MSYQDEKDNLINQTYEYCEQANPENSTDERLKLCIEENEKLSNELRNFRHNVLNIMHGINGYIQLEDWDGLKKYFNDTLKIIKNKIDTNLSSIERIKNLGLKELLSAKLKSAVSIGIDFKVLADQSILIDSGLIRETDLCQVIGILLDNAIEAARTASIKKVTIYLLANCNFTNIIIENTFKEKPGIPLMHAESPTKGEGRGLRLQSVSSILSKYPHILNNTFIQHQVFVQELQIINKVNR